jgi:hypothetical protein
MSNPSTHRTFRVATGITTLGWVIVRAPGKRSAAEKARAMLSMSETPERYIAERHGEPIIDINRKGVEEIVAPEVTMRDPKETENS